MSTRGLQFQFPIAFIKEGHQNIEKRNDICVCRKDNVLQKDYNSNCWIYEKIVFRNGDFSPFATDYACPLAQSQLSYMYVSEERNYINEPALNSTSLLAIYYLFSIYQILR